MRSFLAALQFLTLLPVPASRQARLEDLERSLPYYPLVGLLTGGLLALLDAGLSHLFPVFLTSVLLVIALLLVSGGLHCDGLADTADGFFSSRPREEILRIMKDSHLGPMGAMAVVSVIVLKMAAWAAVPAPLRWWTLLLTPAAAYLAIMLNIALLSYARPEGGLGAIFSRKRSLPQALAATAALMAIGWVAGGMAGLSAVSGALLAGLALAAWTYRKIGGYTGDTLGAVFEISTIMPALVASAWGQGGGPV